MVGTLLDARDKGRVGIGVANKITIKEEMPKVMTREIPLFGYENYGGKCKRRDTFLFRHSV